MRALIPTAPPARAASLLPARAAAGAVALALILTTACGAAPVPAAGPAGDPGGGTAPPDEASRAWTQLGPEPELPADRPLAAGFLVVDGVYDTELTAPFDVLHHVRFHSAPHPGFEVFTVSPDGRPVRTFEGLEVAADYGFANAPPIDVLVVPSAEGSLDRDLEDRELIDWVAKTGERAAYLVSLCDGAFVLAAAGLLDGHAVTTFPGDYDRFAERFPELDLRVNVSFVRDGRVLTSQGGARSFDVAMHLVDHLFGEAVAAGVGRGMVIPWPPAPGQPHFTVIERATPQTP